MTPLFTGLVLPGILLIVGIIGKKFVMDGFKDWKLKDLDLGIDFAVLGMVSCLLNGFELYRIERRTVSQFPDPSVHKWAHDGAVEESFRNHVCMAAAFLSMLLVSGEHHRRKSVALPQWRILVGLAADNIFGYASLVVYLAWVKGLE